MKNSLRFVIASLAGVTSFLAAVLGFEFIAWWWTGQVDVLADPALNAIRFAVALATGLGAGFMVYPGMSGPENGLGEK